mgnify:CR=1 FL=1
MEISLELLLESLQSLDWLEASCPKVIVSCEGTPISEIALLPAAGAILPKNTLWCGFLANILTMDRALREGRSFLALGSEAEFDAISRKEDCNCLCFSQQLGLPTVFNAAASILRRFREWEYGVDVAIANRERIQKLVDITEPLMQNPLVIFDNSFEIQAYSRKHRIDRPQLEKVLQSGRFSGEDLDIIAKMNYLRESEQYATLTLFYPPNWMNCQFALRVFMEGQKSVITMVQYFLESPPTPAQLELLRMFEAKLEIYKERVLKTGQRSKNYVYEPFLIDLVDGHISTKEEISDRIRAINFPFEGKYRLYYLRFEKFTSAQASYTRNNCKSIFPACKTVVYHNALILLNREDHKAYRPESEQYQAENLKKLLEICGACCGVSNVVPDLIHIRTAFLQAQAALHARDLVAPEHKLWYFEEAYFWDMLDLYVNQSGIGASLLYHRKLDAVIENDHATGNDNLHLLDVYLNCDRNITNTAKVMNLHRNSIIYRLDRIEQMLGGSLSDPDLRFSLLVSLKILRYLEAKQ